MAWTDQLGNLTEPASDLATALAFLSDMSGAASNMGIAVRGLRRRSFGSVHDDQRPPVRSTGSWAGGSGWRVS